MLMKNFNLTFDILPDNVFDLLKKFESLVKKEYDKIDPANPETYSNSSFDISNFVYSEVFDAEETKKEFQAYIKDCFENKSDEEKMKILLNFVEEQFFEKKVDIFLKSRELYYSILVTGALKEMKHTFTKSNIKKIMSKDKDLRDIHDCIVVLETINSLQFIRGLSFKNLDNLSKKKENNNK